MAIAMDEQRGPNGAGGKSGRRLTVAAGEVGMKAPVAFFLAPASNR